MNLAFSMIARFCKRLLAPLPDQRGISTLDFAIYTGLVALLILFIGGYFGYSLTRTSQANVVTQYSQLYGAVRSLFSSDPNGYGQGDITATIIAANSAPPAMVVGTALVNSYAGGVTVTGNGQTAVITFSGIPTDACSRLAAQPLADGAQGGAQAISINGANQTIPIDITTAANACNQAGQGAGAGNSIAFTIPH